MLLHEQFVDPMYVYSAIVLQNVCRNRLPFENRERIVRAFEDNTEHYIQIKCTGKQVYLRAFMGQLVRIAHGLGILLTNSNCFAIHFQLHI